MTTKKKIVIPIIAIALISVVIFGGYSILNGRSFNSKTTIVDTDALPIFPMRGTFVYDINNIKEAVGICDYVFVAEVISNDETRYKDVVVMEDENGQPREVGTPYTYYTIDVMENIKGSLTTDESIEVVKHGGISQTRDSIIVFENDELPKEGNIYIFSGYAQKDGSILLSGPNSNVLINTNARQTIHSSSAYQEYIYAVENEIIPIQRERFSSVYEE